MNLDKNNKYVVGVSGGVDSMCLLDMLVKDGYDIVVCHVNYLKRTDTKLDYEIVASYCKRNSIQLFYTEMTTQNHSNFQRAAREFRYNFFINICQETNCNAIITAHHQDDVLETIIMQQERNAKSDYIGIQAESSYRGYPIYRPLLGMTKEEIYRYASNNDISFNEDSSNKQSYYTRNIIRNIKLASMSKEEKESILKHSVFLNNRLLEKKAELLAVYDEVVKDNKINLAKLINIESNELIYYYLSLQDIKIDKISASLLEEIKRFVTNSKDNSKLNIQKDIWLVKEYGYMFLVNNIDESYEYIFDSLEYLETPYFKLSEEGHINYGVKLDKEDFPITIRSYKPGDIIDLSIGHKKVNRLFIDQKISKVDRCKWPILLNNKSEIVLIPGIAKNKGYLVEIPNLFVLK